MTEVALPITHPPHQNAKARESAEDYLKTIFLLRQQLGQVRSIDVAKALGVSKPSVSNAVKKMRSQGLVIMDERHTLTLTEAGLGYAASVMERHQVIEGFLRDILCVSRETAHKDSCRMEHLISAETFSKIHEAYAAKP